MPPKAASAHAAFSPARHILGADHFLERTQKASKKTATNPSARNSSGALHKIVALVVRRQ